jgi:UrcA family protein
MHTHTLRAGAFMGAALACALLLSDTAAAADPSFAVNVPLTTRGLDLNRPADAQTFYARIEHAAYVVCTHGNRADLVPVDHYQGCYQKALGDAVRSIRSLQLTQIYLDTHTLQQARAYGITAPMQLVAK